MVINLQNLLNDETQTICFHHSQ